MRESRHASLDQETLQRNWSQYRERRHREYSELPPQRARTVRWTDQVAVICRSCRHPMGKVVGWSSDDAYGIVEDTARWTLQKSLSPAVLTGQGKKHPPWLWVEGDLRQARAHFRCASCRRESVHNAHRLGHRIEREGLAELQVD